MNKTARSVVSLGLAAVLALGTPDVLKLADVAVISASASAAAAPKTPTASLKTGTYTVYAPKTVKLSCGTKGADIFYKIGSGKYKKYTAPITLEKNCTLSFYSSKNGAKSSVVTHKYNLVSPVDISVPTGFNPVDVTFNTVADDITLYYTTDGSKPTKSSAKVKNGKLTIKKSCTLRVLAVKSGWTSKYYKVNVTVKKDALGANLLGDYTEKFLYNTLNDAEKTLYRRLYDGVMNYEEKIDVKDLNITIDRAIKVNMYVRGENPTLFRCYDLSVAGSDTASIVYPIYVITDSATEQVRQEKLVKIADEYLAEVKKLSTDFERVLYIHDKLAHDVSYANYEEQGKESSDFASADNALINHEAVCLGYAQAMTYLCQYAGIPCFTEISPGHAWNKVNIGGSWYAIDATWDDSTDNNIIHTHFLNTNDELLKSHSTVCDETNIVPEAKTDSTKYTYLSGMGIKRYETVEQIKYMGMKYAANELAKGNTDVTVYFKDENTDKVRDNFRDITGMLASYGAVNTLKSWSFDNNNVVLHFSPINTRAAAAEAISNGLKNGTEKFTINYKKGVIKDKTDLEKLFTEYGIIAEKITATVGATSAKITVKPYTSKSSLDTDGMKKARKALNGGAKTLLFVFSKEISDDNIGLSVLTSMKGHGIIAKTISGYSGDTFLEFDLVRYNSGNELIKDGFASAAKSALNGVSDLLFFYEKGLKSSIDGYILQNLTANGIITRTVSGFVGDDMTAFDLLPYETVSDVKKLGIPNAASAVNGGCKQLTIWYKSGLKSSVSKELKANFTSLMKNYGANVSVKSMTFFDNYVKIILN